MVEKPIRDFGHYDAGWEAILREPGRWWFFSLQGWRYWLLKRRFRHSRAIYHKLP